MQTNCMTVWSLLGYEFSVWGWWAYLDMNILDHEIILSLFYGNESRIWSFVFVEDIFNLSGKLIIWALNLSRLNRITYHNLPGRDWVLKERQNIWNLNAVIWVRICWWPVFLSWILLRVVLLAIPWPHRQVHKGVCSSCLHLYFFGMC